MYTLRIIKVNGIEINKFLGDSYRICRKSSMDEIEFDKLLNELQLQDTTYQYDYFEITQFIDSPTTESKIPIFENDKAYIMHANGQTLQKL